MGTVSVILVYALLLLLLAYWNARLIAWAIVLAGYLLLATFIAPVGWLALSGLWLITLLFLVPLLLPGLKHRFIITPLFQFAKRQIPPLSDTEEQAIAAGTVNWDGELFGGNPNWGEFYQLSHAKLSQEECNFIAGPVRELCQMAQPWDLIRRNEDSPKALVDYIKQQGFMGLHIDKTYGGREFSALGSSEVMIAVGSHVASINTYIAVPNSLGPAELISKYGTPEQVAYYLPRLASGEEVPCFALTGPFAGSDAGSIPDYGVVCEKKYKGKKTLGIQLNFSKRYITLAPVATLIGLAFKLYDPDHLLGEEEAYGITCALIRADTPGVTIGRQHMPLRQAFPNGPIKGKDVFIPLDAIIGGVKMAGQGWRMLIECLSVGRAITLPTGAATGTKVAAYSSGYYARVREQFGIPIGQFEGVQEKLARIAAFTFIVDAQRLFPLSGIARGEKPAVPSAISKYHCTELARMVGNMAMDVHGGKGIMMGPKNTLGFGYMGIPVSITVEGANILTRNMLIFGQGVTRCHPYMLDELRALQREDKKTFGRLVMAHMSHALSNAVRSFVLGLTDGLIVSPPKQAGAMKRYVQKMTRYSSVLAFVSDVALLTLGGQLKRRESLSARLGDVLSMLYMGSSVLKRYDQLGSPKALDDVVHWSMQWLLFEAQSALDQALRNFPVRWLGAVMRVITLPLGRCYHPPGDRLQRSVAEQLMYSEEVRAILTDGIYLSDDPENNLTQLKVAVEKLQETADIEKKVRDAKKLGAIEGYDYESLVHHAARKKVITQDEEKSLLETFAAVREVIDVDDFDRGEIVQDK